MSNKIIDATTTLLFVLAIGNSNMVLGQSYIGYLKKESILFDSNKVAIEVIKKGDAVFIHSKPPKAEFYFVNHIRTNNEGLVTAKNVYLLEEVIEDSTNKFTKIVISDKKNPIIKIRNSTYSKLKFKIDNTNYEIEPKTELSITVPKGTYPYVVTGTDMLPHFGKETLEEFKMYEWDFYLD